MTRLQKYFFRIIALFVILNSAWACQGESTIYGEKIADSILTLKGTDYSGFPQVISFYNSISDSLNAINPQEELKIQETILARMDKEDNDTVIIAANITMFNPTDFGKWFADDLADRSRDSVRCNVSRHAAIIAKRISVARFLYTKSGEPSSISEMERAIDNFVAALTIKDKAALYTSMSTPETLAQMLCADLRTDSTKADAEKIIEEIRKLYVKCPNNTKKFNETLLHHSK